MIPEGSLPCLQQPATGPYPKPDEFSPQPNTTFFFKIYFNIMPHPILFDHRNNICKRV
jgi:hypothetical protein